MIVCSCNIISSDDIERTIVGLLERDAWQLIVPGQIYHELGKTGKCCGCFPNVVETIVAVSERFHREREATEYDISNYLRRLRETLKAHLEGLPKRGRAGRRPAPVLASQALAG